MNWFVVFVEAVIMVYTEVQRAWVYIRHCFELMKVGNQTVFGSFRPSTVREKDSECPPNDLVIGNVHGVLKESAKSPVGVARVLLDVLSKQKLSPNYIESF